MKRNVNLSETEQNKVECLEGFNEVRIRMAQLFEKTIKLPLLLNFIGECVHNAYKSKLDYSPLPAQMLYSFIPNALKCKDGKERIKYYTQELGVFFSEYGSNTTREDVADILIGFAENYRKYASDAAMVREFMSISNTFVQLGEYMDDYLFYVEELRKMKVDVHSLESDLLPLKTLKAA